ncbi:hypothetical protein FKM82_005970 [Ascaphus truei]
MAEDKELNALLDSVFDDFEKTKHHPPALDEKFFQELFNSELAAQAMEEFDKAMKELAEEEPHLVEQFQKLSEAAGKVGSDEPSQQEFTSCLKETLTGLAKNADDLQNSSLSEEELAKEMEGMGMDEGNAVGNILTLMQNIMQNLLSKKQLQDLGHPPKELAGDSPPRLNFDLDGRNLANSANASSEQCLIM